MSNPKHSFVIFGAKFLYKKLEHKTLMKLTPGEAKSLRKKKNYHNFDHHPLGPLT